MGNLIPFQFTRFACLSESSLLLQDTISESSEYPVVPFNLEIQVFVDKFVVIIYLRQHAVVAIYVSNNIKLLLFNNFCEYILNLQGVFFNSISPFHGLVLYDRNTLSTVMTGMAIGLPIHPLKKNKGKEKKGTNYKQQQESL